MFFTPISKQNKFYFGVGPNVVAPLIKDFLPIVAIEATPGIEFQHASGRKTFVQLDISQPVYNNFLEDYKGGYNGPSASFSVGIGF
jgi:hypothetical protein